MRILARVALAVAALALAPALPAAAGDPPVAKRAIAPHRGFAGIPAKACRPGFTQAGPQLCVMDVIRGPASFANAVLDCMDLGARVEDYHDWRYRTFRGDGAQAPPGFWLGPITADNTALVANSVDLGDFDGETSRFDSREYDCAHDLLKPLPFQH